VPSPAARIIAASGRGIGQIKFLRSRFPRSGFLFEQCVQFRTTAIGGRDRFAGGSHARTKVVAEVSAIFIDDTLGLSLAALVVIGGIVKPAIEASVERPIALGTFLAKADAILEDDFTAAMKAVHLKNDSAIRSANG
jgi:hypothetical protein